MEHSYPDQIWIVSAADVQQLAAKAPSSSPVKGTQRDVEPGIPMRDYGELRAYTGRETRVQITTPSLAGNFRLDDADLVSQDNGGTIIVDASGRRWKRLYDGSAQIAWFSMSEAIDEQAFSRALAAHVPRLDGGGRTITLKTQISHSCVGDLVLSNVSLVYAGPPLEFALGLTCDSSVKLLNVSIDGGGFVAKGVLVRGSGLDIEVAGFKGRRFKQTASTGLAAAMYIQPTPGNRLGSVVVRDFKASDVDSTHPKMPVGRGLMIEGAAVNDLSGLDIRRIGPYQDGDGLYVAGKGSLTLTNSYFEDCAKRAVKSQVADSRISGITVRRTRGFPYAAGQTEVDLQFGGVLDGLTAWYARDDAAPRSLASGWNRGKGVTLRNLQANFPTSAGVLQRFVDFSQITADEYGGFVLDGARTNGTVHNIAFLYGAVGSPSSDAHVFKDVLLQNIQANGWAGEADTAVVQIVRGAAAYVKANVRARCVRVGAAASAAPFSYLNPTAGSTRFLAVNPASIEACGGFKTGELTHMDSRSVATRPT